MPTQVELTLHSLTCLKQSEKDGDEMYLLFQAAAGTAGAKGTEIVNERVPAHMQIWPMRTSDHLVIDHCLYVGSLEDNGLAFTLTVMEMDVLNIVKNSIGIVGKWVDDFVGQVLLTVAANGNSAWTAGRHTHETGPEPGDLYTFRVTGNRSDYLIKFKLILS